MFGLSVSSAWGNGHATLWRGLIHGLAKLGAPVMQLEFAKLGNQVVEGIRREVAAPPAS